MGYFNIRKLFIFSVFGTYFALATEVREVSIFEVLRAGKNILELKFVTNYIADEPISHVSLWGDETIVLFKSGEILCWSISSQVSFTTKSYLEIHHQNPLRIFRGRIFCSAVFSYCFLGEFLWIVFLFLLLNFF